MTTALLMVAILLVDLLLLLLGIFGTVWFGWHQTRLLSLTTGGIGLATFVGFFAVTYGPQLAIERAMRNSITASVVAMYLATVGIVTFWQLVRPDPSQPSPDLAPLTKIMVESFQTVVMVVIGFYFTSSAVVEGVARAKTADGKVPGE